MFSQTKLNLKSLKINSFTKVLVMVYVYKWICMCINASQVMCSQHSLVTFCIKLHKR